MGRNKTDKSNVVPADDNVEPVDETTEVDGEVDESARYQPVAVCASNIIDQLAARERPSLRRRASSLDLNTPRGRQIAFNAEGESSLSLDDNGQVSIWLADWIIHEAEVPSLESGEMVQVLRTVLIDRDGNTYATTSPVVAERLARLLSDYPDMKLPEPIHVQVIERRSRRGKTTYHNLMILPD